MKKLIFTLLVMVLYLIPTHAQILENVRSGKKYIITNNKPKTDKNKGFCLKGDIDYEAIVSSFGVPDEFTPLEECRRTDIFDNSRYASAEYYKDGKKDELIFHNEEFVTYVLNTNRFAAFKNIFEDGLRVGDPISRITDIIPFVTNAGEKDKYFYEKLLRTEKQDEDAFPDILIWNRKSDYPISIHTKNGIITKIYYSCDEP